VTIRTTSLSESWARLATIVEARARPLSTPNVNEAVAVDGDMAFICPLNQVIEIGLLAPGNWDRQPPIVRCGIPEDAATVDT
jgi:hypothetical protein